MSEKKKKKRRIIKRCKHDYAYCFYDKKNKCNVYECVICGKRVYQ